MGYTSLTQIALFIISLVVIFTYIKPTFISMRSTQDEIFQYADAADKATQLNQQLKKLISVEGSFSQSDLQALETFLPSIIDSVKVMSDITSILKQNNLTINTLTASDEVLPADDVFFEGKKIVSDDTVHVDFSIEFVGTYEDLKGAIKMFEQNNYPLEVVELTFGSFQTDESAVAVQPEDTQGQYSMTIRTYAYTRINNKVSI